MVIIGMVLFIVVVSAVSILAGVLWKDSAGQNMGKKHMREDWGIEEKEEYHE